MADVSAREAEILESVGEGLTNAQIAARFHLSVRTVESHVSTLLRKLAVPDRRALGALADTAGGQGGSRSAAHPPPTATLVGRDDAVAAVERLLATSSLVTIVATGGAGKTSVARSVAERRRHAFVDLAALPPAASTDLVAGTIAAALGVIDSDDRGLLAAIEAHLAVVPTLLVFDNCEHLLDAAAAVAERLASVPNTLLLATSRERLALPAETVYRLDPLDPDAAVTLFIERAYTADPQTVLDRAVVSELCERLDRLPLAIELAAARLAVFDLADLVSRLDDVLDLLEGGRRTTPRHRSVRDTLSWSHDLLCSTDQIVHRRISVLAGPSSLATIEAIVGSVGGASVAASVAQLCEASLLQRVGKAYRQLDLVRDDAADRLARSGETAEVVERFVAWADRQLADGDVDCDMLSAFDQAVATHHPGLQQLVDRLADGLCHEGRWTEAVAIRERHARLTDDARAARLAGELCIGRWRGDESIRMFELARDIAVATGDEREEINALSSIIEIDMRFAGARTTSRDPDETKDSLRRIAAVRSAHPDDVELRARHVIAHAWGATGTSSADEIAALRAAGLDSALASAMYDAAGAQPWSEGLIDVVYALCTQRLTLLPQLDGYGRAQMERSDAVAMMSECDMRAGNFEAALRWARHETEHAPHADTRWGFGQEAEVRFFMGDFDECVAIAERVRAGWESSGRVAAGYLVTTFAAAGAVCGYRGAHERARAWFDLARSVPGKNQRFASIPAIEADVYLHHGDIEAARACFVQPLDEINVMWRAFYGAVRAEAYGGDAIVEVEPWLDLDVYAAAVARRARGDLDAALAGFEACGARYQAARTRVQMGGAQAAVGRAFYELLGIAIA